MTVKAYRVEYPTYKIQLNQAGDRVVGFEGNQDGYGINISFVMPDHSEYFSRGREQVPGIRVVEFEMTDDFWATVQWMMDLPYKGKGKATDEWKNRVSKLKKPAWSDGKNISKFIKQTALAFNDAWLDVLPRGLANSPATVTYLNEDISTLVDSDVVWAWGEGDPAEGMEMSKRDAVAATMDYMTLAQATRLGHHAD